MTFTVTKEWIHSNKTAGGSWNAKQMNCLSLDHPPPKGWINRISGTAISIAMKDRFELLAGYEPKDRIQQLEKRVSHLSGELAEIKEFLNFNCV